MEEEMPVTPYVPAGVYLRIEQGEKKKQRRLSLCWTAEGRPGGVYRYCRSSRTTYRGVLYVLCVSNVRILHGSTVPTYAVASRQGNIKQIVITQPPPSAPPVASFSSSWTSPTQSVSLVCQSSLIAH